MLGVCGAAYRNCDDPAKKGVHYYFAKSDNNGYERPYLVSYTAANPGKHSKGTEDPPSVSIYGPNGVGFSDDAFDNSPKCDSCICGSTHCPDAAQNHPKTYPDAPSFKLKRGAARGSIELTWTKPDNDGNSKIKDYLYKMEYYSPSQKTWVLSHDWTSAGTDMYELVTGLHSKAYYKVVILSENAKGKSQSGQWQHIKTK